MATALVAVALSIGGVVGRLAASHAILGLVQKLLRLGGAGMSLRTAAVASWLYTFALVALAALAARATADPLSRARSSAVRALVVFSRDDAAANPLWGRE